MGTTKIPLLADEKVAYDGIFVLKDLYVHIHDWLDWRGYDLEEKEYKHKVKPNGTDINIKWIATKEIDEYSQFELSIKWAVAGLTDVEVQKDGGKAKMNKASISAKISANLVLDWQGKWEEKAIYLKFLKSFYEKYLYSGTIAELKGKAWNDGWALFNEIKAFLNLYQY